MAEKKIKAVMIIEIAGRPAEHVKESLEVHTTQLEKIQGVEVVSKIISEPKKLDNQEAYVCFSEIEVLTETFQQLLNLVFDFMPSSIEIIEPGTLELNSQEATMFINNFSGRLHRYDEIAKLAQFKIRQLNEELSKTKTEQKQEEDKPKKISKKKTTKNKTNLKKNKK